MYLSGSKWNVRRRRPGRNLGRIALLLALIGGAVYVERFLVPSVPPLFIPTPTPTRSPATFALEAESFFQAGKLGQAEESYRQAIEANPTDPGLYVALARVLVFSGQYQAAETEARNALLINPDLPTARAVLGWALDFQGSERLIEAEAEIQAAISSDPNSAVAQAYLAEVLMDQYIGLGSGDYRDAIAAAQRSVELDPNVVETHRALGYVLESTGNYEGALQEYQRALTINPNLWMLHLAIGNMYLNVDPPDLDQAIQGYLNASAFDPTNPLPLQLIAQAYSRFGEYGKAGQYAADAVSLDPSNPSLRGDLGVMLYKNGDFAPAVEQLDLAVRGGETADGVAVKGVPIDPASPRIVSFYYTLGLALAQAGRCEEGTPIFEALLRGVPDDEIAVANATEGLILCGVVQPTPTPSGTPGG
ncbi:MAG TPA: tetratricopeptide repeat protein, partial [Desulfurivibrionaceae bacterium]|nr:tetratricopeptide repeat protein [Desulfurivibrionaceae bacterium]